MCNLLKLLSQDTRVTGVVKKKNKKPTLPNLDNVVLSKIQESAYKYDVIFVIHY